MLSSGAGRTMCTVGLPVFDPWRWHHASRRTRLAVMLLAGTMVAGCASISEKECLRGDWRTLGFEDGSAGRSSEVMASYADDCGDYDVRPDQKAYALGHAAGLRKYCTVENGLREGEGSGDYDGNCPAELQADFLDGYLQGLVLARENLKLDYERLQLDFDQLRDQRADQSIEEDLIEIDDIGGEDEDIEVLRNRLSNNSFQREEIDRKIERWAGELASP